MSTRALALLLSMALVSTLAQSGPLDTARLDSLLRQVGEITGLQVKRKIPAQTITREQWKKWVEEEVRRTVKPEEIRADEIALKMFGLIPRDFDLRKATVDLLGEQAAAVYDPRKKRMMVVEGASADGIMADMVLVHELAHALADQHFDLKRFLDDGTKTGEDQTARMAVVEGQAMWVMLEWQMKKMGSSLRNNRAGLDMMLPMMGKLAAEQYPVFSTAPLYLRETLLFPYSAGILFQQAAIERSPADAFLRVLRKPPVSTRQILHPEVWFDGETLTAPPLPPAPAGYRLLTNGTLGELDLKILIEQFISQDDAKSLSPQWRGGAYEVSEDKRAGRSVLRWSLELAGENTAASFLEFCARMIEKKSRHAEFTVRSDGRLQGKNDGGAFLIERAGQRITASEGLDPDGKAPVP